MQYDYTFLQVNGTLSTPLTKHVRTLYARAYGLSLKRLAKMSDDSGIQTLRSSNTDLVMRCTKTDTYVIIIHRCFHSSPYLEATLTR